MVRVVKALHPDTFAHFAVRKCDIARQIKHHAESKIRDRLCIADNVEHRNIALTCSCKVNVLHAAAAGQDDLEVRRFLYQRTRHRIEMHEQNLCFADHLVQTVRIRYGFRTVPFEFELPRGKFLLVGAAPHQLGDPAAAECALLHRLLHRVRRDKSITDQYDILRFLCQFLHIFLLFGIKQQPAALHLFAAAAGCFQFGSNRLVCRVSSSGVLQIANETLLVLL